MLKRRMRGFSLIEMMIVISVVMVISAMSVMSLQPALQQSRVSNAYDTTLMAMRQARDMSVAQRQVYYVTFSNAVQPNTVSITQGSTGTVVTTYTLPTDLSFTAIAGVPTGAGKTPDGFGAGATPIDFDQGVVAGVKTQVYFQPDGSAQDVVGNVNNGVVYIARAGNLYTSHAITLWGATGRLRGWRLFQNAGVAYWRQM
jgi:prepilin-type N-terminal cleavage/methylation domain-containing protein